MSTKNADFYADHIRIAFYDGQDVLTGRNWEIAISGVTGSNFEKMGLDQVKIVYLIYQKFFKNNSKHLKLSRVLIGDY
jgi:hypothetical protein